jgi:hypothetical protein
MRGLISKRINLQKAPSVLLFFTCVLRRQLRGFVISLWRLCGAGFEPSWLCDGDFVAPTSSLRGFVIFDGDFVALTSSLRGFVIFDGDFVALTSSLRGFVISCGDFVSLTSILPEFEPWSPSSPKKLSLSFCSVTPAR